MRMLLGLCSPVDPVKNFEGVNKMIISNIANKIRTTPDGNLRLDFTFILLYLRTT